MSGYFSQFSFSAKAFLSMGFRPFFLLGSVFACVLMTGWVLQLRGIAFPTFYPGVLWHSHELIFGFTAAIISGFLLTAVRNWTGIATLSGTALAGLVLVWLAGRILPFTSLPAEIISVVDLAFFPFLTLAIAPPILKSGNVRNMVFIFFCLLFFLMNLLVHFDLHGLTIGMAHQGIYGALNLVVLIMLIIGGRVIPFFTERALPDCQGKRILWLEKAVVPVAVMLFLYDLWQPLSDLASVLSGILAALLLMRLGGWFDKALLKNPLLWILHLGYLCIALGFLLRAAGPVTGLSPFLYIHMLTTGGIGLLTLGMMSRVALGHTGRPLMLPGLMKLAFTFMVLAVLARVVMMAVVNKAFVYDMAGFFWIIAFALFFIVYLPALISPRVDEQS
ncbi:NnrS family protein [Oceanospirillum sediminis]|uniref:NnrS family protein n=1 Tax=Oceanospirillum sediminis TaxID=2760088 RepID=A0A839IQB5_9GAMM|nr:NnrS family protein [Oceanospirillum sediminis]MBB1487445.1 NnrS family protein [Oceanospirillum sediminis]